MSLMGYTMRIINYIACFMLPIAITNNNDTMARRPRSNLASNQNYNYGNNTSMDEVVKFRNGNNMCGLASLNQCLSVLNPGNNKVLKQFVQVYNNTSKDNDINNQLFGPAYVFESVLNDIPNYNNNKKVLMYNPGEDIEERYQGLVSASESLGCDISKVNNFITLYPTENNTTLTNEIKEINKQVKKETNGEYCINDNTLNLVLNIQNMKTFNSFKNDIVNNSDIVIDNNYFSLSSVAFRSMARSDIILDQISPSNRTLYGNNSYTHFVSAKKLSDGRWILIDSLNPNNLNNIYNSFKSLMDNMGNRYLPRLLFFTKIPDNNKQNDNRLRNINRSNREKISRTDVNQDNKRDNKTQIILKKKKVEKNNIDTRTQIKSSTNNSNKNMKDRINKINSEIKELVSQKNQNIQFLRECLKADRHNTRESYDIINNLYHNIDIRKLILSNSNSQELYDYLSDIGYGYLYKYNELISNMFNTHQRIRTLKLNLSKLPN